MLLVRVVIGGLETGVTWMVEPVRIIRECFHPSFQTLAGRRDLEKPKSKRTVYTVVHEDLEYTA
jgi:hypothetical protein